mgnify:CR=1 FL=1
MLQSFEQPSQNNPLSVVRVQRSALLGSENTYHKKGILTNLPINRPFRSLKIGQNFRGDRISAKSEELQITFYAG